jgi:hypothetical protein
LPWLAGTEKTLKIKKSGVLAIFGVFIVLLVVAIAIGLSMYSGSKMSRVGLLTSYFRALASDDRVGIDELTAPGFFSDLLVPSLKPGAYELFDFGETEGPKTIVQRFLLIVDSGQDGKSAYLADMEYERKMFGTDILAIRMVGTGLPVKP